MQGAFPPGFPIPPSFPPFPPPIPSLPASHFPPPPPPPPGFGAMNAYIPPPPPPIFASRHHSGPTYRPPSVPHQATSKIVPHPSLPAKPPPPPANYAAATISAEPELRDLKKEATAFVPSVVKRKKAAGTSSNAATKINAAPSLGSTSTADEEPTQARPDLMSTLQSQLGSAMKSGKTATTKQKDDYDKFVDEMGDLLGP
jgi:hypothetical protein